MNFLLENHFCAKKKKIMYFKKYQPWEKVIFWQLVSNLANFRRNNSVFMQPYIKKNIISVKKFMLRQFRGFWTKYQCMPPKKIAHLKIWATRKILISTIRSINREFANSQWNITFVQRKKCHAFKNISL